jgi:hypothetical protein
MITVGIVELVMIALGMLAAMIFAIVTTSNRTTATIAADLREFHVRFEGQDRRMTNVEHQLETIRDSAVTREEIESITDAYRGALRDVVSGLDLRVRTIAQAVLAEG